VSLRFCMSDVLISSPSGQRTNSFTPWTSQIFRSIFTDYIVLEQKALPLMAGSLCSSWYSLSRSGHIYTRSKLVLRAEESQSIHACLWTHTRVERIPIHGDLPSHAWLDVVA